MLLGIAALVFDIVIAAYHLQTITFGGQ